MISGKRPYVVGIDIRVPVKNRYRRPRSLGQDRLVGAWAGLRMFGSPVIVVDCGTAITVEVISGSKEYLGGMIIPGIRMSLASLHEKTELLPRISLDEPVEFIGRDTRSCMLSGAVYGSAALIDGLVEKIKARIGKNARVIGTGGDTAFMKKYCSVFDAIEPDLVLKGLLLLHKRESFQ
jgi:type III pantothenate kinase